MEKSFYIQICAFIFLNPISIFSQSDNSWQRKVNPLLFEELKTSATTEVFVLFAAPLATEKQTAYQTKEEKGALVFEQLQTAAARQQAAVQAYLTTEKIAFRAYWLVNTVFIPKASADLIQTLAQRADVVSLENNPRAKLSYFEDKANVNPISSRENDPENVVVVAWGVKKIKADSVWAMGYKGNGVVIGGQDTGFDWLHPALKQKYKGWNGTTANHNYAWHDAIHADTSRRGNPCGYDTKKPCDDNAHGTHTMGSMIGNAGDTLLLGVAPDARWIAARNMDRGNGTLESYVECFQWFVAPTDTNNLNPNPTKAPHVINNSWYCSEGEGCNASNFIIMERAVNACKSAGIVVVVSNGNSGPNCFTTTGPPAFFQNSFSVGATGQTDTIAGFSSRGSVTSDNSGRRKPDVSAPGVGVLSSVPNGGYASYSGTSMAGPHVAGAVALLISANPLLAGQVDTLEGMLERTAKRMTTPQNCGAILGTTVPNNTYGWGRIDVLEAVKIALNYRTPTTKITENQIVTRISPNPFTNELFVETQGENRGETSFELFNTQGQRVYFTKHNFTENPRLRLQLEALPSGIFFYQIQNKQAVSKGKLVKN
jgi:serine protease AprX